MGKHNDRLKTFCVMLAAMGIAAPVLSQAETVQAHIAQVRASRSTDRNADSGKQLLLNTVNKFDGQDIAAVHADAHADGHADGHANLGSTTQKPTQALV